MDNFYFISFDSTNHALQAESYLKGREINISVIPTPREVTQSCGLSIKINSGSIEDIQNAVKEGGLKIKGLYYLERKGSIKSISRIENT